MGPQGGKKEVVERQYLGILHQKLSENFHNHEVTESPLDDEGINISHLPQWGKQAQREQGQQKECS